MASKIWYQEAQIVTPPIVPHGYVEVSRDAHFVTYKKGLSRTKRVPLKYVEDYEKRQLKKRKKELK